MADCAPPWSLTVVHSCPVPFWCRQDHSYLLQAFRFFVANNFLLDYAAGKALEFPQHQDQDVQQAQPASLEEVLGELLQTVLSTSLFTESQGMPAFLGEQEFQSARCQCKLQLKPASATQGEQ